ncbi:MAG: hypothetical protein LAN37_08605 [Acidobacteriia bacterium]|nr:hypothetical protein [Terriglobia bacterium]
MRDGLGRRLARFEEAKRQYVRGESATFEPLLRSLGRSRFRDAASLIRFHDALMFLRAFPPNARTAGLADRLLASFAGRVQKLRAAGADLSPFEPEDVSGIAGTTIFDTFTYEVARWLAQRYHGQVTIDWDEEEQSARLAATFPRFLPLLEEDSLVEADVPYLAWMHAADGGHDLRWLMRRLEALRIPIAQKTEIYDALGITLNWELGGSPASRTLARWPAKQHFFHKGGFIQRREVSLEREFATPDIPVRKLSRRDGEKVMDMVRTCLTLRYRELYGTTRGDPEQVIEARPGRGVSLFLWGLPPDRRLPLRTYHAGLTVKNGVPIGYIEDIGLFEWVEVGFNTFYAYRDGESAWIYSKILHLFHQLFGYTCFSVYPYQIGQGNEEAIKSGAFWFYRKLGFRPGRPELLALAEREEKKIAFDPKYRAPASVLRKLAAGHIFYEMSGTQRGLWDRFSVRNVGMAVQRRMAARFGGDPDAMRSAARARLARTLRVDIGSWTGVERTAFDNIAFVLALVSGLARWTDAEKRALVRIIRSKVRADETAYLRLLRQHARLKRAMLALGTK